MSTNEEVILTIKLRGVDWLDLHFDYHSESNSVFCQLFVQNVVYFLIFLFMKLTHIQVFKFLFFN